MAEHPIERREATTSADTVFPGAGETTSRKKKRKLRSAWISFVGRIVAQIIGAVATVLLSVILVQTYVTSTTDRPPLDVGPSATALAAAPPSDEVALAVLPLLTFSSDPQQAHFADGMTEALITALARTEGLHVISRTSSMHYKDERRRLPEIARELNVDMIVEGSVTPAEDRVRITAQLIDARTDVHLWSDTYDHRLLDAIAIQDNVARAIAREVHDRVLSVKIPH